MAEERVERRLSAILAADIAGYSALMGADEARTVRDLKGHQAVVLPMVGEFGGRIIDTAGDGILAEFPSVVNAVKCAVAIQSKMAERNAAIEPDAPHAVPRWHQHRRRRLRRCPHLWRGDQRGRAAGKHRGAWGHLRFQQSLRRDQRTD